MKAIICDIDGVVADSWWRAPLIKQKPPDWEEFYTRGEADAVLPLLGLLKDLPFPTIFVTGRPESNRKVTNGWLARRGMAGYDLHMRPDGEKNFWKVGEIQRLVSLHEVVAIFEDDPAIVIPLLRAHLPVVPIHSGYYGWPMR